VHTTDSSVRTATDITGLDEIVVPVHTREPEVVGDDEGFDDGADGVAGAGTGLRRRGPGGAGGASGSASGGTRAGVSAAAQSESSPPPATRRLYSGRRPERIERMKKTLAARAQGASSGAMVAVDAPMAAAAASSPPTLVSAAVGADEEAERSSLTVVCERAGVGADIAGALFAEAITTKMLIGLLASDPARARTVLVEAGTCRPEERPCKLNRLMPHPRSPTQA
jgi:hypothetical protein